MYTKNNKDPLGVHYYYNLNEQYIRNILCNQSTISNAVTFFVCFVVKQFITLFTIIIVHKLLHCVPTISLCANYSLCSNF